MAVRIRLTRFGNHKRPFYRIVVADSRDTRGGHVLERIGSFNPLSEPAQIVVDLERAKYWLGVGAQPSDTVRTLLRKAGLNAASHD